MFSEINEEIKEKEVDRIYNRFLKTLVLVATLFFLLGLLIGRILPL